MGALQFHCTKCLTPLNRKDAPCPQCGTEEITQDVSTGAPRKAPRAKRERKPRTPRAPKQPRQQRVQLPASWENPPRSGAEIIGAILGGLVLLIVFVAVFGNL